MDREREYFRFVRRCLCFTLIRIFFTILFTHWVRTHVLYSVQNHCDPSIYIICAYPHVCRVSRCMQIFHLLDSAHLTYLKMMVCIRHHRFSHLWYSINYAHVRDSLRIHQITCLLRPVRINRIESMANANYTHDCTLPLSLSSHVICMWAWPQLKSYPKQRYHSNGQILILWLLYSKWRDIKNEEMLPASIKS